MRLSLLHYVIFFFALLLSGCGNEQCNNFPFITFRESFSQATLPDGYGYMRGGVCGLIITRSSTGNFVAFDRCSTVNPSEQNAVEFVNSSIARDPVSGAEWLLLFDGSPSKLAECPLRQYNVRQQGNVYIVEN